jgi:prevent-host-death family protein
MKNDPVFHPDSRNGVNGMVRTLSSNEVKQRWGAVMGSVSRGEGEVIVESHGKPKVAVISYEEFEAFQKLRKKRLQEEALRELQAIGELIGDRNDDLTPEQVEELADRFSHEFILDLAREGKISFEQDLNDVKYDVAK